MLLDEGISIIRGQPFQFHWAANNKSFVYAAEEVDGNGGSLFVGQQIVKKIADGITFPARYNMDLSSDGEDIVFASPERLIISNLEGRLATLVEKAKLSHPSWSPDGDLVSFVDSGQVYITSRDGTNIASVPNTENTEIAVWSPLP